MRYFCRDSKQSNGSLSLHFLPLVTVDVSSDFTIRGKDIFSKGKFLSNSFCFLSENASTLKATGSKFLAFRVDAFSQGDWCLKHILAL